MRPVLFALFLALLPAQIRAETVFVDAGFGEVGNGWLFGSRNDQSCWVALPWHVVGTMEAQSAPPFFFIDQAGRIGEAAAPVRVTQSDLALAATGGNDDLAFARVTAGLRPGSCTSRLGLPGAGFALALATTERLQFSAMQERTRIGFPGELLRAVADAGRGGTFLVRPANEADRAFMQGGLSGATVLMEWEGRLHPAGMVLSVLDDQSAAVVLRFDKMREAFEIIEAEVGGQAPGAPEMMTAGAPAIAVIGARGIVGENSTPLTALVDRGGCWRAAPPEGERSVEILLSVTGLVDGIGHSLTLVVDPACGPPENYVVELRDESDGWVTISGMCPGGPEGGKSCRLPPGKEMELRLRAAPRQGWLGLSRIEIR